MIFKMSIFYKILVVIVKLTNLGGNLTDLPPFERVFLLKRVTMCLLKLPELRVHVERATKVSLPLAIFVTILRQISSKKLNILKTNQIK